MSGPVIDHDPEEPKKPYRPVPWWVLWMIVGMGWASYLLTENFAIYPIALGFLTGGILATWAIEVTRNETPKCWRSKLADRNRDGNF